MLDVTKNVTPDEIRQSYSSKAGKVDPSDRVALPAKFASKPELSFARLLG